MTVSIRTAAAPVFERMLANLDHVLEKGEADAAARGLAPESYLTARLAPDMFPLTRQVQIATDHAKGAMARLAGREVPSFPDAETTFAELHARIARVLEFVRSVRDEELTGANERVVTLKIGGQPMELSGETYLLHFALPNFYFHVTTAYAILRHLGVAIGKADYIGRP
jgi:hypothetical protein